MSQSRDGQAFWCVTLAPGLIGSVQARTLGTPSTLTRQLGTAARYAQQAPATVVLEAAAEGPDSRRVERRAYGVALVGQDRSAAEGELDRP